MIDDWQEELKTAIQSGTPLQQIVAMLRRFKNQGLSQAEAYAFLQALHETAVDEATDDRVLEIGDFVAGFCSPHLKVWETALLLPNPPKEVAANK